MLNPARKLSQDPIFKNLLQRDRLVVLRSPLDESEPSQRNGTASLETVAAAMASRIATNDPRFGETKPEDPATPLSITNQKQNYLSGIRYLSTDAGGNFDADGAAILDEEYLNKFLFVRTPSDSTPRPPFGSYNIYLPPASEQLLGNRVKIASGRETATGQRLPVSVYSTKNRFDYNQIGVALLGETEFTVVGYADGDYNWAQTSYQEADSAPGSPSPGTPSAVPFGPLTATGAAGETFPLPAGTKELRGVHVRLVNPGPGQWPIAPIFSDQYAIDTSVDPPVFRMLAPDELSTGDKIEGIAHTTGGTIPPDGGGGTAPDMPELEVDDQRNATLSAIPAGATATDYDYQFRPVTVSGNRQADVSQMLGPDESPSDYDYQVR